MATDPAGLVFAETREPIVVVFGSPQPQRRWTVAVRVLLALPQSIVALLLLFLSTILTIAGWFAALALGRLPRPIASFQSQAIGYWARVAAYGWLLTDEYPPFALRPGHYPIEVHVRPTKVSRWAVFFRVFLAIPAEIVASLLVGVYLLAPISWIIVLIRGQMPRALFDANAAALRYHTRFNGWWLMLTSAYPRRLFGDDSFEHAGEAGRLTLSDASKALVVLILALGGVYQVGYWVWVYPHLHSKSTSSTAVTELQAAYAPLALQSATFRNRASQCSRSADPLHCTEKAEPPEAAAFVQFANALGQIRFPERERALAAAAQRDAQTMARTLTRVSHAATVAEYLRNASPVVNLGKRLDTEVTQLLNSR